MAPPPFEVVTTTTTSTTTTTTADTRTFVINLKLDGWPAGATATPSQRNSLITALLAVLGLTGYVKPGDAGFHIDPQSNQPIVMLPVVGQPDNTSVSAMVGVQVPVAVTNAANAVEVVTLSVSSSEASLASKSSDGGNGSDSGEVAMYAGIGGGLFVLAVILAVLLYCRRQQEKKQLGGRGAKATGTYRRTLKARDEQPVTERRFKAVRDPEELSPKKKTDGTRGGNNGLRRLGDATSSRPDAPKRTGTRLDMNGFAMLLQHGVLPDLMPKIPARRGSANSMGPEPPTEDDPEPTTPERNVETATPIDDPGMAGRVWRSSSGRVVWWSIFVLITDVFPSYSTCSYVLD